MSEPSAQKEYELGEQALLSQQWNEAQKHFENVLAQLPEHVIALNCLAKVISERDKSTTNDLIYLRQALKIEPNNDFTLFNIGNYYYRRGAFSQALVYYQRVLEIQTSNVRAAYNVGMCHDLKGDFPAAVNAYLKVIQMDPQHAKAMNNYGIVLDRQDKTPQAIQQFLNALKYSDEARIHNNLAICLRKLRRSEEAIEHFRKGVEQLGEYQLTNHLITDNPQTEPEPMIDLVGEMLPQNPYVQISKANNKEKQGDLDQAYQILVDVAQEYPMIPGLQEKLNRLRNRGAKDSERAQIEHNNYDDWSEQQLREKLAENPNDLEARYRLAIICNGTGRKDEAKQHLQTCQNLSDKFKPYEVAKLFGEILLEDNPEQALVQFLKAQKSRDTAEIWIDIGLCNEKLKNMQEALSNFRKATVADRNNSDAHYHLGRLLKKQKLNDEALNELETADSLKPDQFNYLLKLGEILLLFADKFQQALDKFQQASAIKPQNSNALTGQGRALQKLNRRQEADDKHDSAIAQPEVSAHSYFHNGYFNEIKGDSDKSVQMYNKAIEKKPNHLEALIRLATIQANRGQFDDAIANFNRALGYDPNHEEANFALGKLYHNKDMERAEMHYKKVIEQNKQHYRSLCQLGLIYYFRKQFDTALEHLKSSIAINPNYSLALVSLGNIYFDTKNYNLSMRFHARALKINPKEIKSLVGIANCMFEMKNTDQAIIYYQKALGLNNQQADAHFYLGKCFNAKKNYDSAIQCFQMCLQLNPRKAEAYYSLGNSLFAKKDLISAEQAYLASTQVNPQNYLYFYSLGFTIFKQKREDQALEPLLKSIELNNQYGPSQYCVGLIQFSKGQKNEAFNSFTQAAKFDKANFDIYYHLGILQEERSNFDDAHRNYNIAIRLNPNFGALLKAKEALSLRWPDTT